MDSARVESIWPALPFLGNARKRIRVRPMKARWGICSPTGLLTLNPDLVKTPSPCVDYVIAHELCHLKIHAHSPAFHRLLDQTLPDWRKRRSRLNTFGVQVVGSG